MENLKDKALNMEKPCYTAGWTDLGPVLMSN
jgi:hypothetical protein